MLHWFSLQVDVIVNSASCDLNLTSGTIAKLIAAKAGPGMQKACSDYIKISGNLKYGDIFVSDGFSLPCKFVFHGVCAAYDTSNNLSESVKMHLFRFKIDIKNDDVGVVRRSQ